MSEKRRILSLAPEEEIYITGANCKYALKIKNANNELDVEELDQINDSSNVVLTPLSFDELKRYIILEEFSQLLSAVEVPAVIEEQLKAVLDYHEELIYGKKDVDMETTDFQCLTYY